MGFAVGSGFLLHSPIHRHHSILSSSSSSPFSSQSLFPYSFPRNADTKKKKKNNRTAMASMQPESPIDGDSCRRRAILLVGISVLPLIQLRAGAIEGFASDSKITTQDQKEKAKQTVEGDSSSNPFVFALNAIGILSSSVLGALYALARTEKASAEETIESMKTKLKEKETAIVALEKSFESKLRIEKEERNKQIKKANEEQQSLTDRLNSGNTTISSLGKDLQREKKSVENLKFEIEKLQTGLNNAIDDKKELGEKLKEKLDLIEVLDKRVNLLTLEIKEKEDDIQSIKSLIEAKESEIKRLESVYKQSRDELMGKNFEIEALKDEILKKNQELDLKNALIDDLNAKIRSLMSEVDDSNKKLNDLRQDYMKLEEKEKENMKFKEELGLALNELSENKGLISDLNRKKNDLAKKLDLQLKNAKNLENELQIANETLEKSRNGAFELDKQLLESRKLCSGLEDEISKARAEFDEAKESLEAKILDEKRKSEALTVNIKSLNGVLVKTKEELRIASGELESASQDSDSLREELVEVYKKAESASNDLKEEQKIVSTLSNELKSLEAQILRDKEVRKSLKHDLEEATKSLDEMNRNVLILSRDLEGANSRISILEEENNGLSEAIGKQKRTSNVARENMEDAHSMVMRLGKERESLERRAKKLEEELGSAKGEILRLRTQMSSSEGRVNSRNPANPAKVETESGDRVPAQMSSSEGQVNSRNPANPAKVETESGDRVPAKKRSGRRRRKVVPQQDSS